MNPSGARRERHKPKRPHHDRAASAAGQSGLRADPLARSGDAPYGVRRTPTPRARPCSYSRSPTFS